MEYNYSIKRPYKKAIYDWMFSDVRKSGQFVFLTAPGLPDISYAFEHNKINPQTSSFTIFQNDMNHFTKIAEEIKEKRLNATIGKTDLWDLPTLKLDKHRTKTLSVSGTPDKITNEQVELFFADTCGFMPSYFHLWFSRVRQEIANKAVFCFQLGGRHNYRAELEVLKETLLSRDGLNSVRRLATKLQELISKDLIIRTVTDVNSDDVESILDFEQADLSFTLQEILNVITSSRFTTIEVNDLIKKLTTTNMKVAITSLISLYTAVYFNDLDTEQPLALVYQYRHFNHEPMKKRPTHQLPYICLMVKGI